jgi:N-acetylmuramoyl-L-alanine amidase
MGMRRRLTVMLVGAAMAALVLAMAGVAWAQDTGCKGDIVLDPGHGGTDTGAVYNANGIYITEKAQVLKVAQILKGLLQDEYGPYYQVCMTRTTNAETLSNSDRYTYANTTGAKVLVSIHMNGSTDPKVDYTTTLFGKWQKDKAFAYSIFGDNVNPPKINPPTYGLRTLLAANGTGNYIATKTPYSYASGVLLKSNMPATIAETVFITNTEEAKLLSNGTNERQHQIAVALEKGINNYLK